MSNEFEFIAESRDFSGKSAARASRRGGKVPAVVYGNEAEPKTIVLDHNDVSKHLSREAVYSHILDLNIDGKTEKTILKAVQRHPVRPQILHLDFMRVSDTHAMKMNVPLHFINEDICVGVKAGGVITHAMVDVEVSCLAAVLPEYIEIDLADIDIGSAVHLTDIAFPEGVESTALAQEGDHDLTVAQVIKIRVAEESEEEEGGEEAAAPDSEGDDA
ncbi:MAG: 50S ribosomal protein L25/general stress protein Ctc [Methylococcales bacterium]|nr:50S ribosomal protein L25/general stress protein Ctc [Methylococcales bacterium]